MSQDFQDVYGPWALIAGASEGIGACLARRLAHAGIHLLLVDLDGGALRTLKGELAHINPHCHCRLVEGDLTDPTTLGEIKEVAGDVDVGFLAYVAGAAPRTSDMVDETLSYAKKLIALNIGGSVNLVHHFGRLMKERARGGIMLIGSTCAYAGVPGLAVYSGVKAFMTVWAEALWHEMRAHGVHVVGYNLGSVDTPAIRRNYPWLKDKGKDPDGIAEYGLAHMADGPIIYDGDSGDVARMLAALPRDKAVQLLADNASSYSAVSDG